MTDDFALSEQHKQLLIRCTVYAGLALLVMLPLLSSGYILTLDMVFAPTINIPQYASGPLYIFWGFLHVLNFVLSSSAIQKIILFSILFLSGFGMHRFLQKIGPRSLTDSWMWGCYFGGTLFMINPFTYSRFMAGQFALLLGYALIPFFAASLVKFCSRPSLKTALWISVVTSLVAIISLHTLGILVILAIAIAGMTAIKVYRVQPWRRAFVKWGLAALGVIIVVNSYWIIPAALGKGTTAEIVSSFTSADQKAFATDPGKLGLFGNVLALQGFWGEAKNLFLVPADTQNWWLVPIILLWGLVLFGLYVSYKSRRGVSTTFAILILIGVCLSIGTAGTFVAPLNSFLVGHIPFFAGYREPQKFVALIVFGYSYFGAVGVAYIANLLKKHQQEQYVQSAAIILALIPILCSSLMPWGFRGQLRAADYPVQWYAIRDMLGGSCKGDCKVLFLPWHLYMHYDFAGRIVANPSQKFFGNRIVASNDPELKGAAAYRTSDDQKAVNNIILPAASKGDKTIGNSLKERHIQFIILAKENDYKRYDFLNDQQNIQLVHDFPTIKLYEVK